MDGNLERLRTRMALSRKDLAQLSGVDESTIYRLERSINGPRPSTIRKLARALAVDPSELTTEQGRLVD